MAIQIGLGGVSGVLPDIAKSPILHYDLANTLCYSGSGSTIYDLSGYSNNGTLYNSPTYSSSNNGSLTFNGTNQFIAAPNSTSLNPNANGWSISMWVNPTSGMLGASYGAPIFYNKENLYEGSGGGSQYEIAWQPNWAWVGSGASMSAGTWYHLVAVYDLTKQYIYLDGSLVWTANLTGTMGSNTYDFAIAARGVSGGAGSGASSFGAFSLGVITMYNYGMSVSDVLQNYNASAARYSKALKSAPIVVQNKGGLISIASFTGSGTYVVPSNCTKIYVKLVGGGGGSAGYCESGGAGGYSEGTFQVVPGTSYSITVGGGGGGVGYYAAAGNGGTSSFGSLLSATGGYGANQNYSHGGGHGGVGSGGQVNLYGGSGTGHANSGNHSQAGPAGGGSYFGGPGSQTRAGGTATNFSPAPGSGATGGLTETSNGGTGGPGGLVVVYAYR
jgi:hypothetical protein